MPAFDHREGSFRPDLASLEALAATSPAGAALARYLASRPDLLDADEAEALTACVPAPVPLAPEAVHRQLERELGKPLRRLFAHFAEKPIHVSDVCQSHAAELAGGGAVEVRLARPRLKLPEESGTRAGDASVREDFLTWARAAADLPRQRHLLDRLAALGDADGPGAEAERPAVAEAVPELWAAGVLTLGRPPARPAAEALAGDSGDLRYRLLRSWLLLAVVDGLLVEGPWEEHLSFLGEEAPGPLDAGRPVLAGGLALELDRCTRWDLRDYLGAAAREEPDAALRVLLGWSRRLPGAASPTALRDRLRQAVPPIRPGGPSLAEHLLLHARVLGESGYRPRPALRAFWRSLAELDSLCRRGPGAAAEARSEEGGEDPLRLAVDDARILGTAARAREVLAPRRLAAALAEGAPGWLEALEGGLAAADETGAPAAAPAGDSRDSRARDSWVGFGALALLLASVAALAGRVPEGLLTGVFAGLALLLLAFVGAMSRERRGPPV